MDGFAFFIGCGVASWVFAFATKGATRQFNAGLGVAYTVSAIFVFLTA